MFCPVGVQLVIPQNLTQILSDFDAINVPTQTLLQSQGGGSGNTGGTSGY